MAGSRQHFVDLLFHACLLAFGLPLVDTDVLLQLYVPAAVAIIGIAVGCGVATMPLCAKKLKKHVRSSISSSTKKG